jgi:hypothetical protein
LLGSHLHAAIRPGMIPKNGHRFSDKIMPNKNRVERQ